MQALEISRTALDVEWRRLQVIAQNLANANTVATPDGTPYKPMRLLSGPSITFKQTMQDRSALGDLAGVAVYGVEPENLPSRRVYEPANPQADADGYLTYPGLDHAGEMTLMIRTARAYEANVVAMNAARQMYLKALDVGKS
jgi:flagellar basal-body rod protein FlgC